MKERRARTASKQSANSAMANNLYTHLDLERLRTAIAQSPLKSIAHAKPCDAKTLAIIAAQFLERGYTEQEALKKANVLYLRAFAYLKEFASLPASAKAVEAFGEEALEELAEAEDLAIGDSEVNSPALKHFRETATTKLDRHMPHKKFVQIVERRFSKRVEKFETSGEKTEIIEPPTRLSPHQIEHLHLLLRKSRSRKRAERRKKKPVKKNRKKRGL